MRKNNVDFGRYASIWVSSTPGPGKEEEEVQTEFSEVYETVQFSGLKSGAQEHNTKNILWIWQTFVQQVNPLTKILHIPTLQQRILAVMWDTSSISDSLATLMFAVYNLVITPMSPEECENLFGESRVELLTRYRSATVHGLVKTNFLATRNLEILQALTLFLFSEPESELTCTLVSAAIRLGQMMGLHKENTELSVFDNEMRIRLWWQLRCLDSRSRAISNPGMRPLPACEFGDVRLPLNVNDADLHPEMVVAPVEHDGPTEMICVMMKFEFLNWLGSSPKAVRFREKIISGPPIRDSNISTKFEDEAINDLEAVWQGKYTRDCDTNIPLHALRKFFQSFAISRMRFKILHPRKRAPNNDGDLFMSREESDLLFESALITLEMVHLSLKGKLASHLFIQMTVNFQIDVYIYVVSELRRRFSGNRVALAWRLIEELYNEHPELIHDMENSSFVAFGNLTLEAWEERQKEIFPNLNLAEIGNIPQFISLLSKKRNEKMNEEASQIQPVANAIGLESLVDLQGTEYVSWEHWTDFLDL
ncbi:hypothetical protein Plec18167_004479 [Paecilomyces lecythidis]|uniref:Xylanolytic transcriptional activator regulatory domain-containing protein n=1 Tax=Paecilomyces lecythidis TaxID=3004212 RepID=A0ABR3XS45_9EURO